jgi:IrrE N-terminal-like domain
MEDELRKADLLPSAANPSVQVERFLEAHLGAELDQYAELNPDVLGVTEFRPGRPPRVLVNKDVTGSAMDADWVAPGIEGRWRATLAHEGAHILLHRALFELNADQGSLFGPDASTPDAQHLMRCLKREVAFAARVSDWREVQANRAMAALLMPRAIFLPVAKAEIRGRASTGGRLVAGSPAILEVAQGLAERFAVSRQAAMIRLTTLGFVAEPGVTHLAV